LTLMEIRRTVKKLLEKEFPRLTVLSREEIPPESNIQTVARICWDLVDSEIDRRYYPSLA